jgi:hypothetical protein
VETEFFYGQTLTSFSVPGHPRLNGNIKENRFAYLLSFVFRKTTNGLNRFLPYAGLGAGGIYSDFDIIGNGWGYGGQIFAGSVYPVSKKLALFMELKYIWAPDVTDFSTVPGYHYKSSGNSTNNIASHLFGPHNDTQIIALMIGTRFRVW